MAVTATPLLSSVLEKVRRVLLLYCSCVRASWILFLYLGYNVDIMLACFYTAHFFFGLVV
jgi:hypothetical protein